METLTIGKSDLVTSRLVYGCMRIVGDKSNEAREKGKLAVRTAIDEGFTHFDHADIYAGGQSEVLFSEVLKESPGVRETLIITSKCGIRGRGNPGPTTPGRYDFSKAHILESVDGILSRLGIESLDILLLHRPDYLCNGAEVAKAFGELLRSGKVQHFGVSNFTPPTVSMLQSFCSMPLLMNQLEVNIHNIDSLLNGALDQCQEMNITPQAWCPLGGVAYPAWGNTFSADDEARIKAEFDLQAEKYGVENWVVMLAWILKHPSKICPVIGTTTPSRIKAAKQALALDYSREDWYRLLEARNGRQVP